MSGCDRYQNLMEGYLAGEISSADLELLRGHSGSCAECRRIMELHEKLTQATEEVPEPSEAHFQAMRAAVRRHIRGRGRDESRQPIWKRWAALAASRPALAGALAACIAAAFILGRLSTPPPGFDDDLLLQEVTREASQEKGLAGYWDAPFVYSNVTFHPRDDGSVALSFDVTRHLDFTTPEDSPVAREILLHAILDPSEMGSRLKAIALAPESMDGKLKEVLVFTLLNDPNLAVRLKALDILIRYAADPTVQEALLRSVGQDPSVQIRLLALDGLAGQRVDPEDIRRAIGKVDTESDRAVLHHAVELTELY